jgi:two-component system, OmpR family, sensor kinase
MFLKSIRFKIVIWYTIILALVLSLFSVLVYINLRKTINDDLNNMLQLKAEGVADSIETYWEVEKEAGMANGATKEVFSKVNNINFIKIAQRWVNEQSTDPELLGIIVNIFDPQGKRIASSENASGMTFMYQEKIIEVMQGRNRFENRRFQRTPSGNTEMMRVFSMPIIENKKLAYILQVARPMTTLQNTLSQLRFNFLLMLPLVVLLSSVAGFFLAALIIRPLRNIIGSVRRITAENLKLRIETPETKDEIKELVDTFNAMLEKLDESFSSQKQLIQDISHELRTPLTIMRGEMEVALKKARSPEEYIAVLESGLEEINRLSMMVENMLILSRYDSHEVSMDIRHVDISGLLDDIVSDVQILAKRKGIIIARQGSDELLVNGDEDQVRRAFLNVIDNAIKYTPEGGNIRISLEKADGYTRVKVADNGIGISPENLPLLFNRFFRADESRSSEGYGLGLSICKSIIEAHKGRLSIKSDLGHGTTLIIELPD